MNFKETRDYLFGLRNRGSKFGIDRMAKFVDAIGRPDRSYPIIHVAGTNGKGSVSAMLEAIFREAGYKTGLFVSPHLVHVGERVQINRNSISEKNFASLIGELDKIAKDISIKDEELHPTFFEFMVGLALVHYKNEDVDIAIIETGLGGRLDATNVVTPVVSVITSIGLDHIEILGDSYEKIAFEKAGIIKEGIPAVLGRMAKEASDTIREVALHQSAMVASVEDMFGRDLANYPKTVLHGSFQRTNAGTALTVVDLIKGSFPKLEAVARDALFKVDWPGRWQKITLPCGRNLILDATHNAEGSVFLEENLKELVTELGEKPRIVAGTLGEIRAKNLMPIVGEYARELYLLEPNQPRTASYEILRKYLPDNNELQIHDSEKQIVFPGLNECSIGVPGDTILVTGSIYLLGEILEILFGSTGAMGSDFQDLL